MPQSESAAEHAPRKNEGQRTIVTLAVGPAKYLRMAFALMESCHRVAGDSLDYIVFSDLSSAEESPYVVPPWMRLEPLQGKFSLGVKEENLGIKSLLFQQPILRDRPVLFLDSDTWVYANHFDEIFRALEERSILIAGEYLEKGERWQTIDYCAVAARAGLEVRNMSLNAGLVGRQPDELGLAFGELFFRLMAERPLAPHVETFYLKNNDDLYVALAFQLAHRQCGRTLPATATTLTPPDYISTYRGHLTETASGWPTVHKPEKGLVQPKPAMIHFYGAVDCHHYFVLQNRAVARRWSGWLRWPVELFDHLFGRARARFAQALRRWRKRR